MRVLHVGKALPPAPGGMESYLADLLRAQQRHGLEVAALVHEWPGFAAPEVAQFSGIRLYTCPSHGQFVYAPLSPGFPQALHRALADFRPQVLHLHLPNTSAFSALLLPAARRLPWVLHWHADVDPQAIDWRLRMAYQAYRPLESALLKRAARVVATSQAYLDGSPTLSRWRQRCEVVPLGIDLSRLPDVTPEAIRRVRSQWPRPQEPCFLAVGRLTYYKGFEVLLQALSVSPRGSLVLVGDGPRRSALELEVRRLGLGGRVRLLGALAGSLGEPVLAPWFAACDALCLPSLDRSEAFGIVLLEAARYGRRLVASDVPGSGVGWVTRTVGSVGGWQLVPPGNAPALADALQMVAPQCSNLLSGDPVASIERTPDDPVASGCALEDLFSIDKGARDLARLYARLSDPETHPTT
jgi:glycosyltransferase involved in cell wall biosynthesis